MIIEASAVLTPEGMQEPGWIEVDGGDIADAGPGRPPRRADYSLDATVVPGFIDAHVHGGGGYSFSDPEVNAADRIAAVHLAHGTTTMMASLVTRPHNELVASVRGLAGKVRDGVVVGIHLEGPWLSPDHRGAHAPEFLQELRMPELLELLEAGAGTIRMVTLAPELDGSREAIAAITAHGAKAAIGHTGATYAQTLAAIEAGARIGTHLFNGMRPVHHREPGPATALLENSAVFSEVIADGVHLHPAAVRTVFNSPCRAVLVTDAMAAACAPDGRYALGGVAVDVHQGQARAVEGGSIAGSTLTLDAALRYTVNTVGIPLPKAVEALTGSPAAMLGLSNVGRIEAARRADLVALDGDLEVKAVMRAGQWVSGP